MQKLCCLGGCLCLAAVNLPGVGDLCTTCYQRELRRGLVSKAIDLEGDTLKKSLYVEPDIYFKRV